MVSNPEFLREGSALNDFMKPDRVVLGSSDRSAAEKVAALYEPLNAPIIITDIRTAEMIKYASNAILATRISFINEIAHVCEQLGADVQRSRWAWAMTSASGTSSSTPGIGYGGSCFPKDVKALAHMAASSNGSTRSCCSAVMEINQRSAAGCSWTRFASARPDLSGQRIGVLGPVVQAEHRRHARGAADRDHAGCWQARRAGSGVRPRRDGQRPPRAAGVDFCSNAYEAAAGADAVLLLTEWNEFKQIDLARVLSGLRRPVLIDGRNMFVPAEMRAQGFEYASVGRP